MAKTAKSKEKKDVNKIDSEVKPSVLQAKSSRNKWLLLVAIVVLTFVAYLPGFSPEKEFTNWDDRGYIVEQPLAKSIQTDSLKILFEPSTQVMLNYHPLTMISLAYNYANAGLDIQPYFKTNLLLHILNTVLVFFVLYRLGRSSLFIAGFGALFFGIHPMHVESVAWISERKDVLYTFFFLASLLTYLIYSEKQKMLWLVTAFTLFVASCLSKAMAVPLPLVFFLVDYLNKRKFTIGSVLEKLPFLALSVWIGLNAVKIQSAGAIAEYEIFTTFQRVMFASYGFLMYWVKFFVPTNLSAFYPYPTFGENQEIPTIFYASPFIVLMLLLAPFVYFLKRKKELLPIYIFGMGFFILMIALVLQFISVGSAIMADRYAYVPYIGGSFILLFVLQSLGSNDSKKRILTIVLSVYSVFLLAQCYNRVGVWTNSETLWTNVIEQYPYDIEQVGNVVKVKTAGVEVAYKNRGNYYRETGRMDLAFVDYEVLVRARAKDPLIYSNAGNMYALQDKFKESIEMYKLALERDSTTYDVYLNRGITFSKMNDHTRAAKDFEKAFSLKENDVMSLVNLCAELLNAKQYEQTIKRANLLTQLSPNSYEGYFYRGTANVNLKNYAIAIVDLNKAIGFKSDYSFAWFNTAVAYNAVGNKKKALEYALKAKSLGMDVKDEYLNSLR